MKSSRQTRVKPALSRPGRGGVSDLVIYGPPGTGKTRRLVEEARMAIGPVTFCSHARATARAAIQSAGEVPANWTIGTLHSLCFRRLGLSRAQVVADHNLFDYCKRTGFHLDSDEEKPSELRFYMHCHGFARNQGTDTQTAYEACGALGSRTEYGDFCRTYDQWRRAYGFVDYTDMLTLCAERGFDLTQVGTLVIDEAQDLTPLHWRVVNRLTDIATRVVIAGDDDQAIYEWAGANPHGMGKFTNETAAEVEVLSQSYRVPQSVYDIAQKIANRIKVRQPKSYEPRPEAGTVVKATVLTKGLLRTLYGAGTVMLLFRNKYMRATYERLMQEARVPYVTERGTGPLQQHAGKAYLRLLTARWQEPEDIRVIRTALTPYGLEMANNTGYEAVANLAVDSDRPTDVLKATAPVLDYIRGVGLKALKRPVDLRTIHASKGLEADSVVVVSSLTRKSLESMYQNPDAEHRVHYVAVTRARKQLVIIEENAAYDFPA